MRDRAKNMAKSDMFDRWNHRLACSFLADPKLRLTVVFAQSYPSLLRADAVLLPSCGLGVQKMNMLSHDPKLQGYRAIFRYLQVGCVFVNSYPKSFFPTISGSPPTIGVYSTLRSAITSAKNARTRTFLSCDSADFKNSCTSAICCWRISSTLA
jgi:hypothetical protein